MTPILIIVVLLLGNAFFVGAEFSLIASRRTVIEPMAETSTRAAYALRAMNQIPLMIAGAQLGITICGIGLGAIAEPAIAGNLAPLFHKAGLPEGAVHPTAFVIALAIVVFLHTVIGEMVPKNITLAGPEVSVTWLGPPMLAFCTATKPLLLAMKCAARKVLVPWKIEAVDAVKTVFTAEELAGLVAQASTEGLLDEEEHRRITGALALHQRKASDALRPWSTVTAVTEETSPASLEVLATRTGWSRFPVIGRASRQVLGFVHVKDVIGLQGAARRQPLDPKLIRALAVVPPERSLAELLLAMRRERRHMVLVSENQVPLGVVTLDDVLTAIMTG